MKLILTIFLILSFNNVAFSSSNLLEDEKNTIGVFKNSVQSVVNVSNFRIARRGLFFDVDPMEVQTGAGSGFLWDDKGHIVTNYHVVASGEKFAISFHKDKKQYKAKLVGVEPAKDIAVLKLEEMPKSLTPIKPGVSKKLQVGQKAMALGNPFGLDHTITSGIISALGRQIQGIGGVTIKGMIQTDSSINPGNSGGPLLNSSGEVIGMNTLIFSKSGSSAGIGFAVPVDTIKRIVPQIIKHGKVIRPGLGIGILDENHADYFDIKKGIVIKYVGKDSSAKKAGLRGMTRDRRGRYYIGDVILEIDGKETNSFDDIYHILDTKKVGDEVEVLYEREGKKKTATIELMQISSGD